MKEVKKTKVPLPIAKPKQKPQKAPPKPELSQEFVDSDDDSHTESTAQPKKAEKPKATIGIHVNGVAKSKTKPSKTDAPSSKSTSKPKASPKKPAPKQVVTERDVEELSSSEISDDDAPARDIQTKLPGNEASKKVSSDSDSDDTSSSEDSSDESDTDDAPQAKQNPVPSQPQAPAPSHVVDFQPTKAYVPPKGFNPVPLNDKTISRSTDLFANLEGKQIWHITAPAGVSLKDLKQFAMDKASKGEVVLNHKGTDYAFSQTEKSEDGARQVILPQKDGMKPVSAQIAQTLRLRSVVQIPQLNSKQADQNTGSEAAASITRSTIRAPRPQVTGLKMRFLPIGFAGTEGGLLDGSDGEAEPTRETAVPESSKQSKKQKRKHADVNGGDATEAPSKKSKKHLDPEEEAKRKAEKKAKKEKKRAKEASSVAS